MQIPFQKLIIQTVWCLLFYSLQVWDIPYERLLPWIPLLQWFKVQSNDAEHSQVLRTGKIHLQAEFFDPVNSFASSNIQGCISFFSEFKAEVHLVSNQGITLPTWYKLEWSQAALICTQGKHHLPSLAAGSLLKVLRATSASLPIMCNMCMLMCLHHTPWVILQWSLFM